ncbi:MAG: sulfate ABC transporter permease subunit CysT [Candidatus Reconcilbacillus cellulovorans]|uniref:Sulfate transport system permease protein CysT n=1 Tax=Candidatus Reconcilbacillus cellulovorans TaxID=1906605 RepID=A0A2A6E1E5_9BACL|nr:MAG: sulfate ABC transporter permease subunit CysT [Candidatus Reconcilbacillus cellulovorans]
MSGWRRRRAKLGVLPGFGLSMGFTLFYLALIVLIPLSTVAVMALGMSWESFWRVATSERALAAYRLSFGAAFAAAAVNLVFGTAVAWLLVRYRFPGKRLLDAAVDLPFALPTAVAGISLTTLYSTKGWIGAALEPFGVKIAYTPLGVAMALVFVGFPFVVRSVQPVLEALGRESEEAAATLGASWLRTFFRVVLPELVPAALAGFVLALARGVGEYGSVIFIAGNMPMKTEIAPLLIMTRLEQFDYPGAAAIALVMLVLSFALLFAINVLQWKAAQRLRSV